MWLPPTGGRAVIASREKAKDNDERSLLPLSRSLALVVSFSRYHALVFSLSLALSLSRSLVLSRALSLSFCLSLSLFLSLSPSPSPSLCPKPNLALLNLGSLPKPNLNHTSDP